MTLKRLFSFKKLVINKKCDEKGFTLLEVLIALTIFSIGLLALAGMQITGIQGNSRAQAVSAKNALADGVVEEFLAMAGDDTRLTNEVTDSPWTSATNVPIDGAGTCSATVSVDPSLVVSNLTQIVVTVSNGTGADVIKTIMKRRYDP